MKNQSSEEEQFDRDYVENEKNIKSKCCICSKNCGFEQKFSFTKNKNYEFRGSLIKSHIDGEFWEARICDDCTKEKLSQLINFEIKTYRPIF